MNKPLFLDYHATTPLDPRVWKTMQPYFTEHFGNPHSAGHSYGWDAETAVETARAQVASLIHANPKEIIFTSGATESTNIAIKGAARFEKREGGTRNHIITLATEHKCVLESAKTLREEGVELTVLPVQSDGLLDIAQLEAAIKPETLMVSVMAVNNEIGVIQNLATIGAVCRKHHVLFHTDAAQGFGKIPLDVEAMQIDLMSISGHKIYAPKGIGALYIRRRPRVRVEPLFSGGGQERDIRSGTVPPALVVGLGKAAEIAGEGMEEETKKLTALRHSFIDQLKAALPNAQLNGHETQRVAGNISLSLPDIDVQKLMKEVAPNLAISSSSACSSAAIAPSYVLKALGKEDGAALATIRIGLGRFTTQSEVDQALEILITAAAACRLPVADKVS